MPDLNALLKAWTRELAQALEMMTGESFVVSEPQPASEAPSGLLWWTQGFTTPSGAVLSTGAEQHVWLEVGTKVLQGAGVELVDAAEARSTWFELLQQAAGGAVRAMTTAGAKLETGGTSEAQPSGSLLLFSATVTPPDGSSDLELTIAVTADLLAAPAPKPASAPPPPQPTAAAADPFSQSMVPMAQHGLSVNASRTMDALLDVELQVSISFGQTLLPLRDVLKLTTGTVVELNRLPEEPVDIIVNDCVVARGEVVVVEGNYAVRIQDIMSRQQRLGLSDRSHVSRGAA